MKIGVITPVGRTDKFGYQYEDYNKLIIKNLAEFADRILVISTSKHNDPQLYENIDNLEYFSNKDTWFNSVNDNEEFSFAKIDDNVNFCRDKLIQEGYDVSILIHSNQFVPKSNQINLKNFCAELIKKKKPFEWLYKKYMCGKLIFYPDRKVPWILNLTIENPWNYRVDSIIHKDTKEIISIQTGKYKKYTDLAIMDVPWDLTIQDEREKHDFFIKELRILNNTYNPNDPDNLKFNEAEWISYMQRKVDNKKLSNEKLDDLGEEILKLRRDDFCSHIYEKNYKLKKKFKK